MDIEKSYPLLDVYFQKILEMGGSDLYMTEGMPPSVRVVDKIIPIDQDPLNDEKIEAILQELLPEDKLDEFQSTFELNTAIAWKGKARFRINVFKQQMHPGLVIRRISTDIPTPEMLNLPKVYCDLVMEKRGLLLVVGTTGSGKSTSLAAMIGHRNHNGSGHIITIEDPIEFVHQHKQCIITQRDLGIDTYSFGMALKNALRQRPDVVLIGEIRDRETMEHAINFAETGHLCLATLHANNANQAIERILNFFPEEKHRQVLVNLAHNIRGILSQRLVTNLNGTRSLAVEVLLNRGLVKNLIEEGKTKEIKDVMEKNRDQGMQTFDQCLLELYTKGEIAEEVAIAESDNPANVKLHIKQQQMGTKKPGDKSPNFGSLNSFNPIASNNSQF
jgi:twitching motility protein PilU